MKFSRKFLVIHVIPERINYREIKMITLGYI